MDARHEEYASTLQVNHFKPENVPWRRIDLWRPIEDGSNTQYRLGVIESLIPPHSQGPIFHFHEMHDEGFYVTKGKVRFHIPGRPSVDVAAGEMITVPVRLPHRFSNPFDEESVFINTATPGFFVRYFEHLENMIGHGKVLTPEVNAEALKRFATIPLPPADVKRLEETGMAGEKKRKTDHQVQQAVKDQ